VHRPPDRPAQGPRERGRAGGRRVALGERRGDPQRVVVHGESPRGHGSGPDGGAATASRLRSLGPRCGADRSPRGRPRCSARSGAGRSPTPSRGQALPDPLAERLAQMRVEERPEQHLVGVAEDRVARRGVPAAGRRQRILDASLEALDRGQLVGREEARDRGDERDRRRTRRATGDRARPGKAPDAGEVALDGLGRLERPARRRRPRRASPGSGRPRAAHPAPAAARDAARRRSGPQLRVESQSWATLIRFARSSVEDPATSGWCRFSSARQAISTASGLASRAARAGRRGRPRGASAGAASPHPSGVAGRRETARQSISSPPLIRLRNPLRVMTQRTTSPAATASRTQPSLDVSGERAVLALHRRSPSSAAAPPPRRSPMPCRRRAPGPAETADQGQEDHGDGDLVDRRQAAIDHGSITAKPDDPECDAER
jgi:hypothetical protein